MTQFSPETWVLLVVVAGAGVLAILSTLCQAYAHERRMHELKGRVFELRGAYARRLAEIAARDVLEVEPEGAAGAEPTAKVERIAA